MVSARLAIDELRDLGEPYMRKAVSFQFFYIFAEPPSSSMVRFVALGARASFYDDYSYHHLRLH